MRIRLTVCLLASLAAAALARTSPMDGWDFKFKGFAIGAWWGPDATEAEMRAYKAAGFNIVMAGRYMQLDDYGHADKGVKELDLAAKHGLGVMFDTYTKNDKPWGGKAGQLDGHPNHHAASLIELQWLHKRLGKHPALIGFMIGDDKSDLTPRLVDCTNWLRKAAPRLMPWICQNSPNPQSLAEHGNPIFNPQIYPTLYNWGAPADVQAHSYVASFAMMRRACRDYDLIFWPMINVAGWQKPHGKLYLPSDSLTRFPIYAACAYGCQGIWYFTYNGGALQAKGPHATDQAVQKALTPLYPIVRKANLRLRQWGGLLLGRQCVGLFATAWTGGDWPFEASAGRPTDEQLVAPAPGKLVEAMSDRLLVGILTKPDDRQPLAMVVDCRVSKGWEDIKPRKVELTFHKTVESTAVHDGGKPIVRDGRVLPLELAAGEGLLVELRGAYAGHLATMASIYAPATTPPATVTDRKVTAADLKRIVAAKLAIEVFGADGEPQYADKRVSLNGTEVGRITANDRDRWDRSVIDLKPEALKLVKMANQVTITGKGVREDAWKCRGAVLAVQLADGSWVKTNTHATVFGRKGWAHFEGKPFPANGVVGPLELKFP